MKTKDPLEAQQNTDPDYGYQQPPQLTACPLAMAPVWLG
tara:strand:+ start:394 stop:510 length:117 start_codon:yes stop_codon:yes gene_type:complete